jgi:hypothetical protein
VELYMTDLSITAPSFSLAPKSLDEALRFADMLSTSSIIPKDFANNPGNIIVAIQWGMELGLQPMQAMQSIAVINGRPALWGDAVIALVRSSSLCEYVYESLEGDVATCRVKRRGEDEQSRKFSMADAKAAGLQGKSGPWSQYPKRMLQLRARAFALRDVFPDVLRGMPVAEEVQDFTDKERDITQPKPKIEAKEPEALPPFEADKFAANLTKYQESIDAGKATAAAVIAKLGTKYTLSPEQIQQIESLEAIEGEPV